MPYIIVKRSDIPDGVLQATLDLKPNTSLRNFPYQPVGQTRYEKQLLNQDPVISAFTFQEACAGLRAWFLTNVSSGSGVASTGQITTDPVAAFLDGDTLTISDGITIKTFVFVVTAGYAVVAPNIAISLVGLVTNNDVRDAIIAAVNAQTPFNITAAIVGAGVLSLTNTDENIPAALRNIALGGTGPSAPVAWAVVGMAGGTNSAALTPAQALADANTVLNHVGYNNNAIPASPMTVALLNAALPTGKITESQLVDILRLLEGNTYTVPAGVVIQAGGFFTYPAFTVSWFANDVRAIYASEWVTDSYALGRLGIAASARFAYLGIAAPAIAIYNADGSLYTVIV
jgi:hypothetical protein